ncbi:SAV_915 family protein [Streptomyces sp. NPDC051211]|uniref:SAV_915 family protein n=1 Tax=Streptomyces sp. NPDC051211 TaxID=3154643 RepID=UPI00344E9600
MCLFQYADDPEPEEQVPAGLLYVPVRPDGAEVAIRMFRTPLGERTAAGFTGPDRLAATLGAGQPWVRLSESALRGMAEPLGVALLTIDPVFSAPAVTPLPAPTAEVRGPAPDPSSPSSPAGV